jgi:hypothetical protein
MKIKKITNPSLVASYIGTLGNGPNWARLKHSPHYNKCRQFASGKLSKRQLSEKVANDWEQVRMGEKDNNAGLKYRYQQTVPSAIPLDC